MATNEQIEVMFNKLERIRIAHFLKRFDDVQAGIGAVLRMLYLSQGTMVTAGKISEVLGISTARVAVLLKKLSAKGLITKEHDIVDARITVVKLTELGKKTVLEIQQEMYQQMGIIIDKVGEERLLEFIDIFNEIEDAVEPPKIRF